MNKFIIHNTVSFDNKNGLPFLKTLLWSTEEDGFEVEKTPIPCFDLWITLYFEKSSTLSEQLSVLGKVSDYLSSSTQKKCKFVHESNSTSEYMSQKSYFTELQFDSLNILGKLVPNHPLLRIINVLDTKTLESILEDTSLEDRGINVTAFDTVNKKEAGFFFDVKFNVEIVNPSNSFSNVLFKNFSSIQSHLFLNFNAFVRDYVYFENTTENFCLCRNDLSTFYPLCDTIDSNFINSGSVDKNGTLSLTSVVRDTMKVRNSLGNYKTKDAFDKYLRVFENSNNMTTQLDNRYFNSSKSIPSKDLNLVNVGVHCMRFDDQLCGIPDYSFHKFARNTSEKKDEGNNISGDSFHFMFISSSKSDIIHLYMSGSDFKEYNGEFENSDSDSENLPLTYEKAKYIFSLQTGLSGNYFKYLCYRIIPFVFEDKGLSMESCKKNSFKLYINRYNSINNKTHSRVMKHLSDLCNSYPTSVLFYNDLDYFFHKKFDFPKYKSIPFNCYCCGNYDDLLSNFGLIKESSLPYIGYSYYNIFENHVELVEISSEISSYCSTNLREIMLGNKNLWHLRAMEYAFLKASFGKPTRTRLEKINYYNKTSVKDESEFLLKPSFENRLAFGGYIGEATTGWHSINEKMSHDSKRNSNDSIYFLDYDSQYAAIICEFELGYITHEGFFQESQSDSWSNHVNADVTADLRHTNEPYLTVREYLKLRRFIKNTEGKSSCLYKALKLLQNSMYGCIQAKKSAIRSKYFGNCITGNARYCLLTAINFAPDYNLQVICSQTDSLAVVNVKAGFQDEDVLSQNVGEFMHKVNSEFASNFVYLVTEEKFDSVFIANKNTYLGIRNLEKLNEHLVQNFESLKSILWSNQFYTDYNTNSKDWLLFLGADFKFHVSILNSAKESFYSSFRVCGFVNCNWAKVDYIFFFCLVYYIVKEQQIRTFDPDNSTTFLRENISKQLNLNLLNNGEVVKILNGSSFLFSLKRTNKKNRKNEDILFHTTILDFPPCSSGIDPQKDGTNKLLIDTKSHGEVSLVQKLEKNFNTKTNLLTSDSIYLPSNSRILEEKNTSLSINVESPLQLIQFLSIPNITFLSESKLSTPRDGLEIVASVAGFLQIKAFVTDSTFIYAISKQTIKYFEILSCSRREKLNLELDAVVQTMKTKKLEEMESNIYSKENEQDPKKNIDKVYLLYIRLQSEMLKIKRQVF